MADEDENYEKVSSDTFFRIRGAGLRAGREKAENKEHFLDIGNGVKMPFKLANLAELQSFVTSLVDYHGVLKGENEAMKEQLANLAAQGIKPRIRVAARSVLHVVEPVEIWKQVPGADKRWECSPEGKFRDTKRNNKEQKVRSVNSVPNISMTKTSKLGYRQTIILNAAKAIAEAFCTRRDDETVLHFKDGSRFNIAAQNMMWIRENDPRRTPADFGPRKDTLKPVKSVWGKA